MNIQYTTGLFDGEGCVSINKNKQTASINWHYTLIVRLQMTNKVLISNLLEDWGGNIFPYQKPNTNWKDQWVWNICGSNAIVFLNAILPYTIIKKQQIELALTFQALLHPKGYNKKLTPNELTKRETCYQEMKLLNKRGK